MEALKALVDRFDEISEKANVDAVFGKPETVEGRVLIPVAEMMVGFGDGGLAPAQECTCECGDRAAEEEACECEAHESANGGGGVRALTCGRSPTSKLVPRELT